MKIIKPLDLGLLYRTYELNNHHYLVSTILAFFSFENPDTLEMDLQLWPLVAEELGTDGALDTGMPKVGAEFLIAEIFILLTSSRSPAVESVFSLENFEKSCMFLVIEDGNEPWAGNGS